MIERLEFDEFFKSSEIINVYDPIVTSNKLGKVLNRAAQLWNDNFIYSLRPEDGKWIAVYRGRRPSPTQIIPHPEDQDLIPDLR